jgi:hypothetical protein
MGISYGFILQREKILATILAVYVAWAVANVWAKPIFGLLTGKTMLAGQLWFRTDLTLFHVQVGLFVVIVVLLALKGDFADITRRIGGSSSPIIVFLYSFLNAGLVLSIIFSFMGPRAMNYLSHISHLANLVIDYKNWWIVAPAVIMIIAGFMRGVEIGPPQQQEYQR